MQSKLLWDGKMGFTANGDSGHPIKVDVSTDNGGNDSGPRPMELILHGLGGCSGTDVVSILHKMQQKLERLSIEINGTRADDFPKRFTKIQIIYHVAGTNLDPERVKHAVDLSLSKYCSVAGSLNAEIVSEVVIESELNA